MFHFLSSTVTAPFPFWRRDCVCSVLIRSSPLHSASGLTVASVHVVFLCVVAALIVINDCSDFDFPSRVWLRRASRRQAGSDEGRPGRTRLFCEHLLEQRFPVGAHRPEQPQVRHCLTENCNEERRGVSLIFQCRLLFDCKFLQSYL